MKIRIKNILIIAGILILLAAIILIIEKTFGIDLNIGRRQWGTGMIDLESLQTLPLV